jgi:hypothetical protein
MATTSQRLVALEADVANLKAWKAAHVNGHVLSGHSHPGDATDADVAALDARLDALEGEDPLPDPTPTPPPGAITRYVGPSENLQGALNLPDPDVIRLRPGSWTPGYVVLPKRPSSKPLLIVAEPGAVFTSGSAGVPRIVARGGASYCATDGLAFDNVNPGDSGLFVFGGYNDGGAHHIAHRRPKFTRITGTAPNSHIVYLSKDTVSRVAEIDLDDFDVDIVGQSVAGLHSYNNPNAINVRARRWTIRNPYEAMLMWSDLTGLLAEGWSITGAKQAIDIDGPRGILRDITATGSGQPSSVGAGITQERVSLS